MVTILPKEEGYSEIGERFGTGFVKGYQDRSDEMALQKAVQDLGPNASARDIINAVTGAKTYGNESKQKFFKNIMGAEKIDSARKEGELARKQKEAEFEEQKRHATKTEEQKNRELDIKAGKQKQSQEEANLILEQSNLPEEKKKALKDKVGVQTALGLANKLTDPAEYEIAKNQAKRFEPAVEHYQKKAFESEQAIPLLETAIFNNEAYSKPEKYWDTALDTVNSPFLNQFKSKTGQELEAIVPVSVASFGAKMSGVLSNQKINLISKKAVGLGKDKNANRMMLYLDLYDRNLDKLRAQFTNDIIKENKYGLPPADFQDKLNAKLKPYQEMINKDITRLLNDKKPDQTISQLGINSQVQEQLQTGEVAVMDKDGNVFALPEEDLDKPEYKDYQRIQL